MPANASFWSRMRPLGGMRCRVLSCLGADNPKLASFFDPPPGSALEEELRSYLERLHEAEEDPTVRRIAAAGLLTLGELRYADEIIRGLPQTPIRLDHGAGWCPLLPYSLAAELLPLPEALTNAKTWIAGTAIEADLMRWFEAHRERLVWDPAAERFVRAS
ncbi:MAG TPA: hypothetical protein VMH81_15705 [Bryobacteraceae bacterium]|nr:hypothetical protein [Bryobacteraceae bacterium]